MAQQFYTVKTNSVWGYLYLSDLIQIMKLADSDKRWVFYIADVVIWISPQIWQMQTVFKLAN